LIRRDPADARSRTTTWGVVIAVAIVGATVALNAPGGSNSIAGRAITATMVTLFPPQPTPPAPAPAAGQGRAGPPPQPPAAGAATRDAPATQAPGPPAPRAEDGEGKLSEAEIAEGAAGARGYMSHAPAGVEFRNVHAIMTLGLFNAESPDTPFLGFCGEIKVPEGEGWGRPGWKPFFISRTPSLPVRPQGRYLDMANPSTEAKCAYGQMETDYTRVFMAGETDTPPPWWWERRARSNLPAISPR